jgi:lysophospholipase L1-like esterase
LRRSQEAAAAFAEQGIERFFLTDQGDPIHPNAAGHRLIGELLVRALLEQNRLPAAARK